MEIRNILVNLDIDVPSPTLVRCAADLATRFNARVIGFAAAQPSSALVGVDGAAVAAAWYDEERGRIEAALRAAEENFRLLLPGSVERVWRSYIDSPNRVLTDAARSADLILVGSRLGEKADYLRSVDVGDLVLSAGRPVLAVGNGVDKVKADKIVIAWKDTREARRAVVDALPFLKAASEVFAVIVDEGNLGPERLSLADLVDWLTSHAVKARGEVLPMNGGLVATIESAAASIGADLVVSGGYGHSRFREWLFGGMTQNLLASPMMNRFLSN